MDKKIENAIESIKQAVGEIIDETVDEMASYHSAQLQTLRDEIDKLKAKDFQLRNPNTFNVGDRVRISRSSDRRYGAVGEVGIVEIVDGGSVAISGVGVKGIGPYWHLASSVVRADVFAEEPDAIWVIEMGEDSLAYEIAAKQMKSDKVSCGLYVESFGDASPQFKFCYFKHEALRFLTEKEARQKAYQAFGESSSNQRTWIIAKL